MGTLGPEYLIYGYLDALSEGGDQEGRSQPCRTLTLTATAEAMSTKREITRSSEILAWTPKQCPLFKHEGCMGHNFGHLRGPGTFKQPMQEVSAGGELSDTEVRLPPTMLSEVALGLRIAKSTWRRMRLSNYL